MTLVAGAKLGPYEIVAPLGAGGMGEVYRARDTRLGREVAIKVLPEGFAQDPERLQRFEQEARVLGALNHPNLLAIFDVGSKDGLKYLVSEFLEGKTLREHLNGGALPQRKVVEYSTKIANGLAAAHEKGIVHRDLKPENVFVTNDEQVKILDFGLAKSGLEAGQTLTTAVTAATAPGTVMGTVGYMSPEQVRGQAADSRSDIFSFGAMLYEMASGKRAFIGDSAVEAMNAILKSDPPEINLAESKISPGVERILEHCLEKNPADRFQSARDLGFALSALSGTGATAALKKVEADGGRSVWMWAAGSLTLLVLGMAAGHWIAGRRTAGPVVRATLTLPQDVTLLTLGDGAGAPALSPDGRNLAFAGIAEGKQMLFLRPLSAVSAKPLAGTEGGKFPFWSPDGKSIGFFADKHLKRVDLTGSPPLTLAAADDARGGTWAGDVILYAPYIYEGIWRVPALGGTPTRVTTLDKSKYTTHRWPNFLPDGKHFLFLAQHHMGGHRETAGIYATSIEGGTPKFIVPTNGSAIYSLGYLLYYRDGMLMAQEFDTGRLELKGDAVAVGGVLRETGNWGVMVSASANGLLLFQSAGEVKYPIAWFDRRGQRQGPATISGQLQDVRLSPDGTRAVVVELEGPQGVVSVYELKSGSRARLSFGDGALYAVWSPDGKQVAYSSQKAGLEITSIYLKSADGAGKPEVLLSSEDVNRPTDWTRDGKYLVVNRGQIGAQRIWLVPLSGNRKPVLLFPDAGFDHFDGRVSPDGKWITYVSAESGVLELYVTSFPEGKGKWQLSSSGTISAGLWGADGKDIYFVSQEGILLDATVQESPGSIRIEGVHPLFRSPFLSSSLSQVFDIDPKGGQRFIGSVTPDTSTLPLNVISNWTEELKKK